MLKIIKEARKRDKDRCVICGKSDSSLTVHHITTKGAGGKDQLDNLITLCFDCHRMLHDGKKINGKFYSGKHLLYYILITRPGRFIKFITEYKRRYIDEV